MKRDQRKIIKHVQSGSLLKLKSLLEKLSNETRHHYNLNFKVDKLGRTPLHIACLLGDDAIVRCLLKHGADSNVVDANKDTPIHIAAQYICDDGNYEDYKLIMEPLLRKFPDLLSQKNRAGKTPVEILKEAKEKYNNLKELIKNEQEEFEDEKERESEWASKLISASEGDHYDLTKENVKFAGTSCDEDYQTYDQWAQKIYQDYQRKHVGMQNRKRKKEFESRRRKQEMDDVASHLLKRDDEYLIQVKRMKTEVMARKREQYERKISSMKTRSEDSKLRFIDIPWPCRGNATEMVALLLTGVDAESPSTVKKRAIMKQLVLWHPDKFEQRCGDRLLDKDRERILETVKAIAQELNKQLQILRSEEQAVQ